MTSNLFRQFRRDEWSALRSNAPLALSDHEIAMLRSAYDRLSVQEVEEIYLPLSRFLHLHMKAARSLSLARDIFLGQETVQTPFVIAISGSVAVGKSTFARVFQALISRWPERPKVDLVTTDGFLYPNSVLEERGLMHRKGFPESYDLHRLIQFLADIKTGADEIQAPLYSHLSYDVLKDEHQTICKPDILVFEGLNVLQAPRGAAIVASDYFDFSIYLDADEADIEQWYIERFLFLQQTAFQQPQSYFHRYRDLPQEEAKRLAARIWQEINLVNLKENIQPTRQRADLILHKASDHSIREIRLRQI